MRSEKGKSCVSISQHKNNLTEVTKLKENKGISLFRTRENNPQNGNKKNFLDILLVCLTPFPEHIRKNKKSGICLILKKTCVIIIIKDWIGER